MNYKRLAFSALFLVATTVQAGEVSGRLQRDPWSGTFWPLKQCWMSYNAFSDGLAPFEKYDNFVNLTRGQLPLAALREADPAHGHNEAPDPKGESWTGHCHGWSAAAIMEPEPPVEFDVMFDRPVSLLKLAVGSATDAKSGMTKKGAGAYASLSPDQKRSLEFRTADLKAMLTEVYTECRSNFWGTRCNDRQPDPTSKSYSDVKPHVMHQLLVEYIGEKNTGLVFDVDPGYQVWNQPVYRFESQWTETPERLEVTTTIHWANDLRIPADFHGLDSHSRTYTYVLIRDASGSVVDSSWTGASIANHPDFIWCPYGVLNGASAAALDLDVVHEILAAAGQTVKVVDAPVAPGASAGDLDGTAPGNGNDSSEERRRNLWERVRDRVGGWFGGR